MICLEFISFSSKTGFFSLDSSFLHFSSDFRHKNSILNNLHTQHKGWKSLKTQKLTYFVTSPKSFEIFFCDALRDLVPFVQFKKREKHPWMSVTFSKMAGQPATLLKVTLLHGCFSRFLNCTNGTKSRKVPRTKFVFSD